MSSELPMWLVVPIGVFGVVTGWMFVLWVMREFEVFGRDEPEDPATGLKGEQ